MGRVPLSLWRDLSRRLRRAPPAGRPPTGGPAAAPTAADDAAKRGAEDGAVDAARLDTLLARLRATVVGLLEVHWQLVCPYCHAVAAAAGQLAGLPGAAACRACARSFRTST